jgi:CheY-like chemotaxis protein
MAAKENAKRKHKLGMEGLRVLVVEDSNFLGELIRDLLSDAGSVVIAHASSVTTALAILGSQPVDLACLDILLGHETSFAVADVLAARRIPFVFVTACDPAIVPERHRSQPLIDKMEIAARLVSTCRAAMCPEGQPALSSAV